MLLAALAVVVSPFGGGPPAGAVPAVGRPARSGIAARAYSSAQTTATFARIARRAADRAPLTLDEAFPPSATMIADSVTHAGMRLKAKRLDADCAKAVWGSAPVADVLRRGGCSQAVRALYADPAKGYAATLAIFNLADATAANRLVTTFAPGHATPGFLVPPAAPAPLDRFAAQGFSTARGVAMGHYAMIIWAARLDGRGDELDEGLMSLLVTVGEPHAIFARTAG